MKSAGIEGYILLCEVNRQEFAKKVALATELLEHLPKIYIKGWCTDSQGYEVALLNDYFQVLDWDDNSVVINSTNSPILNGDRARVHLEDGQCWKYVKLCKE